MSSKSSPKRILLNKLILDEICINLTFPEAISLRDSLGLSSLKCQVSVSDLNQRVNSFPVVNDLTIRLFETIQEVGSNRTLSRSVDNSDLPAIRMLLENGANPNLRTQQGRLYLLSEVIRRRQLAIARLLIEFGARINRIDWHGSTPLIQTISFSNQEIFDLLMANGANPNLPDINKTPPLIHAIRKNQPLMVERLIEAGANLNLVDRQGKTFLDIAMETVTPNSDLEIIRTLLEAGLNPKTSQQNPLITAIAQKNLPLIQLLLEYGADSNIPEYQELVA